MSCILQTFKTRDRPKCSSCKPTWQVAQCKEQQPTHLASDLPIYLPTHPPTYLGYSWHKNWKCKQQSTNGCSADLGWVLRATPNVPCLRGSSRACVKMRELYNSNSHGFTKCHSRNLILESWRIVSCPAIPPPSQTYFFANTSLRIFPGRPTSVCAESINAEEKWPTRSERSGATVQS